MDGEKINNETTTNRLSHSEQITGQIESRKNNYRSKFGVDSEDCYFLPLEICNLELQRAKSILAEQGKDVDAKMVPYQEYENLIGGFEISVDGRRFCIPRDDFLKPDDDYLSFEVSNIVVSVLEKEKWPSNFPFEMTPKTESAMGYIADNSLVDWTRDLAKFLQLGDKNYTDKRSWLKNNTIKEALEKFGISDIDELKMILSSIGLEIINTTDRLVDVDNTDTEVDALLEAIKKSQAKPRTKRRWIKGTL